jgi:hypothetical protein
MAKIIESDTERHVISKQYSLWRIILIGALLGVFHYYLTVFIGRYVDSTITSGDIATVLVATAGIIIMISLRMTQPLIIAIASGVALWGLAQWTDGLVWSEAVAWSVLLYGLSYTLFSWIARYTLAIPVVSATVLVVILVRVATIL